MPLPWDETLLSLPPEKYAGKPLEIGYSKQGCESIYNIQIMEEKQTIIAIGAVQSQKRCFHETELRGLLM
jgi:hypothetical protein